MCLICVEFMAKRMTSLETHSAVVEAKDLWSEEHQSDEVEELIGDLRMYGDHSLEWYFSQALTENED
jgi:hypothetical protein